MSSRAISRAGDPIVLALNAESITYARLAVSCAAAAACGVLGVDSAVHGLCALVAANVALSACLLARMRCRPSDYTPAPVSHVGFLADGVLDNLLPSLVVWAAVAALF